MTRWLHASALALILGTATLAAPVPAHAVNEACPGDVTWDADNDGLLTAEEYNSFGTGLFDAWDDDESGFLTQDEFNDCLGDAADSWFLDFDDNDDYRLTEDEFFSDDEFAAADENDDDQLDSDEFLFDDFFI